MADGIISPCTWLWNDRPLNSVKRPPYWKSTYDFDLDHITADDMSFRTSPRNFIQIRRSTAETNQTTHGRKMTSCPFHLFCKENGCQNATVNNAIETVLKYTNVKVNVDFRDGRSPPSWILVVQKWVLWKAHVRLPVGRQCRPYTSKLFSFWENRVFGFWRQTDRQSNRQGDRQTDGQAHRIKPLSLSRAAA